MINLISQIKQKNGAQFPLIDDADFLGGFRSCTTLATRNSIPASYRKSGMFVWVDADASLWCLNPDLVTWTEILFGGAGTCLTDTLGVSDTFSAGSPVALDAAGTLVRAGADTGEPHEVYGLSLTSGSPSAACVVVTSGVINCPLWTLTPGLIYYLGVGGGITSAVPDIGAQSDRAIVRVGTARSSTSLLVRVQIVAMS